MAESTKAKSGYLETPVRNPHAPTGTVAAYLSLEKVQRFLKYGPAHKFYEAQWCVRSTLCDPHAILRYNEDEWRGYCYARSEEMRYTNSGSRVPVEPGFVFLVFVTEEMRVIEWGFEYAKRDDRDLPMNDRGGSMREVLWRR